MKPASNLYERIGGAQIIEAAVINFYSRIIMDPILVPFFDKGDVVGVMINQRNFLTMAFGGPLIYTGKTLRRAHEGLVKRGLSDVHFDQLKSHLVETLKNLHVDPELAGECLAIVEGTRADVLGK